VLDDFPYHFLIFALMLAPPRRVAPPNPDRLPLSLFTRDYFPEADKGAQSLSELRNFKTARSQLIEQRTGKEGIVILFLVSRP
jgi:hypothetical protein